MPFDSIVSTLLSSLLVSLTASASMQSAPSALQAFSAAFWSAATNGKARFWYEIPIVIFSCALATPPEGGQQTDRGRQRRYDMLSHLHSPST